MARESGDGERLTVLLNRGMDESVAERMAPPGTLRRVVNMRLRDGQLVKRAGCSGTACSDAPRYLCGASSSDQGALPSLISRVGRAPVVGNSQGILSAYDRDSDFFFYQGLFGSCKPVRQRYGWSTTTMNSGGTAGSLGEVPPSVAVDERGNLMFSVCDNAGQRVYTYVETAAGVRIYYDSLFGTYSISRAVATASAFELFVQSGTSVLRYTYTVATTGVPGTRQVTRAGPDTVATLSSATAHWDVAHSVDQGLTYLAYQGSTTSVTVAVPGGSSQSVAVSASSEAGVSVSALTAGSLTQVWLGLYDDPSGAGELHYAVLSGTLGSVVLSKTLVYAAGSPYYGPPMFGLQRALGAGQPEPDGHTAFYVARHSNSVTGAWAVAANQLTDAGGFAPATPVHSYGAVPISKPDDHHRVWCLVGSPYENQLEMRSALLRLQTTSGFSTVELAGPVYEAVPAALSPADHPQFRWDWGQRPARFPRDGVPRSGSTFFASPELLTKAGQAGGATALLVRYNVHEYQTLAEDPAQVAVPLGGYTVVGGQPTQFWAQPAGQFGIVVTVRTAAESGFLQPPTIATVTTSAAAGPGAGTYSYVAVYEWTDAYGDRHRSGTSLPFSVTLTAGQRPTVTVTACQLTQRQFTAALVSVVLYRSLGSEAGGASAEHYRCSAAVPSTTSTPFVSIADSAEDGDIGGNEILYLEGGVLDFALAPSCRFLCRSEDRVWAGGLWNPRIVQCSRLVVPREPVQWADDDSHRVDLGSECTGLAYMDGQVLAFTRDDVRVIGGEGPNDQGIGGFPGARILSSGVGCTNYRSVLETPVGVLFQYGTSIYLVPRGLGAPVLVSAPVRESLDLSPAVVSAAYSNGTASPGQAGLSWPGRQSLARFLVAQDLLSPSDKCLTLDLDTMQWFEDSEAGYAAIGSWPLSTSSPLSDSAAPDHSVFVLAAELRSDLVPLPLKYEAPVATDADGSYVGSLVRTAWVSPWGLGGWGTVKRVMLAAERVPSVSDPSSLTDVTLSVETDSRAPYSGTWAVQQGTTAGEGDVWREIEVPHGRCTKFRVTFSDSENASDLVKRGVKPMTLEVGAQAEGNMRQTNADTERK